jgi:2-dehydropantoate 2-reductase
MRIAILGAGAIGATFGHLLHDHGHKVVLVDVWAEHVEAINAGGLAVEGASGRSVRVPASTEIAAVSDAEAVLILVKTFAIDVAARSLLPVLGDKAIAVTVQNGIGNDVRLGRVLGERRVVQGSTTVGAQILGPGRIRVAPGTLAGESHTLLGRPRDPSAAGAAERFAAALSESTLPATVVEDVHAVVWNKLAYAAVIGPLCATLGCTVADVLERSSALAVLRRGFEEVVEVGRAEGVKLDLEELWSGALATYASIGPHPPSLAVDFAQGRPTEIDSQLGEVRRRAAAAGRLTPASDVLVATLAAS